MTRVRLGALLLAFAVSVSAEAAEVLRGDVARSAAIPVILCPTPPRTSLYSGALAFKDYLWVGDAMAFDANGNLYGVDGTSLQSLDTSLQPIRTVKLPEGSSSLAVDAAGFAYVVGKSGIVYVYSAGGAFQRRFALPNLTPPVSAISIDVSPNGCTLVYIGDGGFAYRYDACAQIPLPAIAAGERFQAIRALSDGGIAGAVGNHINFYDATGRLVYELLASPDSPVLAMAFDAEPNFVWIANETSLFRMHITDHAITAKTSILDPHNVIVFGELRPSAAVLPSLAQAKRRSARP
ncbi:MAG TPA: hypothetical protein VNN25_11315 [Thermoanaerobaculia bacterium]|nr:hypothetical protein [Thermoanaerobaculia bacterium]